MTQMVVAFRKKRFDLERASKRCDSFVEPALLPKGIAQIDVRLHKVGLEFERSSKGGDRFLEPPVLGKGGAQIVVRLHVVRLQLDRASKCGRRFDEEMYRAACFAEVVMSEGIIRVRHEGLANQIHSVVVAAHLMSHDSEKVQRIGMVWLHCEDLAAERFRVRKPPHLLVLERKFKGL
jgi:hypothetical protein